MREAIKVLASEDLVTIKMRRGAYVTEVAKKDLEQIFTVLSPLEGEAARETATKATEEELNQLDYWLKRDQTGAESAMRKHLARGLEALK